jgi:hypothetical protein
LGDHLLAREPAPQSRVPGGWRDGVGGVVLTTYLSAHRSMINGSALRVAPLSRSVTDPGPDCSQTVQIDYARLVACDFLCGGTQICHYGAGSYLMIGGL